MEKSMQEKKRFAVLIDSENISSKYAKIIFDEMNEYGMATYRRIYGNWAKSNGWSEKLLLENSIMPIQQFSYTSGKNSTDMAMVIDAMDIFYSGKVEGFCLVTSDSDFTRLAMRLREGNMFVMGMGDSKAPDSLTKSCNKFVYLDILAKHSEEADSKIIPKSQKTIQKEASKNIGNTLPFATEKEKKEPELKTKSGVTKLKSLEKAISDMIGKSDNGKVVLSEVGNRLTGLFPDYDVRNYGYSKLSTLISEKFINLKLKQDGKGYVVTKNDFPGKEELESEIVELLKSKGGSLNNISMVQEHLKKMHPGFDVKDYGYSKISNFMKSMKEIKVVNNSVTLKNAETTLEDDLIQIIKGRGNVQVHLSQVCTDLKKRYPDFDVKKCGHKNFSNFLRSMDCFHVDSDRVSLK